MKGGSLTSKSEEGLSLVDLIQLIRSVVDVFRECLRFKAVVFSELIIVEVLDSLEVLCDLLQLHLQCESLFLE